MTFDIWSLLLAWGAGQGALLSSALALKRTGNVRAHRLLALLIAGFAALLVEMLFVHSGYFYYRDGGFVVPLLTPLTLALGPLYVFYARALLGGPLRRGDLLHLVPAALACVNLLPAYVQVARGASFPPSGPTVLTGAAQLLGVNPYLEMALFVASLFAYAWLSRRRLSAYEAALAEEVSVSRAVHAGWLRALATLLAIVAVVTAFGLGGMVVASHHVAGFELAMALTFSLVVHATGVATLWRPQVFASGPVSTPARPDATPTAAQRAPATAPRAAATAPGAVAPAAAREARYARSGLTAEARAALTRRLVAHMERARPYLDPELSRADLAAQLDVSPHLLSEILSEGVGASFFDFVNGYRVREVQRRMAAGDGRQLTMLALALESGFASKASFNRVFKKLTGRTPSAWLREPTADMPPIATETSHPSG